LSLKGEKNYHKKKGGGKGETKKKKKRSVTISTMNIGRQKKR